MEILDDAFRPFAFTAGIKIKQKVLLSMNGTTMEVSYAVAWISTLVPASHSLIPARTALLAERLRMELLQLMHWFAR